MPQQVPDTDGGRADVPAAGLKVLVVEDEALIRLDLAEMLTEEGYVVAGEAGDGDEVPAVVDAHAPHVVLMDLRMPRVNGIAATQRLRARPHRHLPRLGVRGRRRGPTSRRSRSPRCCRTRSSMPAAMPPRSGRPWARRSPRRAPRRRC